MIKESLKNLEITALNEMQQSAIAAIYAHRTILLHAPTGSGKTLAYLLPVSKLIVSKKKSLQAMIIVPSRELALQIAGVHKAMQTPVPMICCYGGHSVQAEKRVFLKEPAILVGTPGRIAAHMRNDRFDFSEISILVLDEFDKSLEFGFNDEMMFIVGKLKKLKKRICISATRLESIPEFIGMVDPFLIEFTDAVMQPQITLKSVASPDVDKLETLFKLIKYIGNQPALIFCNHRESVERVTGYLQSKDIEVLMYHGGMEQRDRERSLLTFRNGSYRLLVTTDLAARGLDIPEIGYIIHYHLPSTEATFIHRNGRTARMNTTGTTFIIFSPTDKLPAYLPEKPPTEMVTGDLPLPDATDWVTLHINAGRRDKICKADVVGFLLQKGRLRQGELGLVEVTDREAFAAVKRAHVKRVLGSVANELLKRKKVRIEAI